MEYIQRRTASREWNQPKRKKCVAVNKAERSWRSEEHLTSDMEIQSLEFAQLVFFNLVLVQYFLSMLPSIYFETVMYILCHYVLEVCD